MLVQEITFNHIPRLCNGVAHRLVKFGLSVDTSIVWFEELPDVIRDMSSSKTRLRMKFFININRFYFKELWVRPYPRIFPFLVRRGFSSYSFKIIKTKS